MKQSSKFDPKSVQQKLSGGSGGQMLTRRNAIIVGVGAVVLAAGSAWYLRSPADSATATTATAPRKRGKVGEVPVDELMKAGPLPDMQVGNANAPVTVVEYASMTCGHCANFHNNVYPALKAKYIDTGKARLIMREFPLDDRATGAAMLARCAGEDKAFPIVSALFAKQDQWAFGTRDTFVPELSKIARQVGFTEDTLRECLRNQELMDKILANRQRASETFGVDSTPTFFVNGKRLDGGGKIEDFDKAFEPFLKS